MAKVIIKTKGETLNGAEFENAATEASIRELIAATKKEKFKPSKEQEKLHKDQEKLLKEQAADFKTRLQDRIKEQAEKRSAKTASSILDAANSRLATEFGGTAEAIMGATEGFTSVSAALYRFAGPIGMAAAAVFGFGQTIGAGLKAVGGFFTAIAEGKTNLSDYVNIAADALSQIPIFGGVLGGLVGILGKVVGYFEELNQKLFTLSKSGASFNNNLMEMRTAAAKTGLALDEFADKIQTNAVALAQFGGTVTEGALAFANLSKTALATTGRKLMNMGFSLSDVNDGLLDYMELNKAGAMVQQRSTTDMAESATNLMTELDAMAKITGETRKQQAEKLKKEQADAAYQLKLASMSEEERIKTQAAMAQMGAKFGETGMLMQKFSVLGMPMMTKETQLLAATLPGATQGLDDIKRAAKDSNVSFDQFTAGLDKTTGNMMESGMASAKSMETVMAAGLGIGGTAGKIGDVYGNLVSNGIKAVDEQGKFDRKKWDLAQANARAEQKKTDGVRDSLNTFSLQIVKIRTILFEKVLQPIYEKIQPVLARLGDWFEASGDSLSSGLSEIGDKIAQVTEFFAKNIVTDAGRELIMDKIISFFEELLIKIREKLGESAIARMMGIGITKGDADKQRAEIKDRNATKELAAAGASKELDTQGANLTLERANKEAEGQAENLRKASIERLEKLDLLKAATNEKERSFAEQELKKVEQKIEFAEKTLLAKKQAEENLANIDKNITKLEADAAKAKEEKASKLAEPDLIKAEDSKNKQTTAGFAGMAGGAATGAVIGSIVPVLGTAIGAAIGGIIGGVGGYIAGAPKEGREGGSLEEANKLIEDFGKGTPMMLHGEEGVLTKDQLFDFAEQGIQSGKVESQKEMRDIIEKMSARFVDVTGTLNKEAIDSAIKETRAGEEKKLPPLTPEAQSFKSTMPSNLLDKLSNPLESAKEMIQSMVTTVKETVDKGTSPGTEIDKVAASIRESVSSLAKPNSTKEQIETLNVLKDILDVLLDNNSISKRIELNLL